MLTAEIEKAIAAADEFVARARKHLLVREREPFKYHHTTSRNMRRASLALTYQLGEMRRKGG